MKKILLYFALLCTIESYSQVIISNNWNVRFNGFKTAFSIGAGVPSAADSIARWDSEKNWRHFGKSYLQKDSIFILPSIGAATLLVIDTTAGVSQGQIKRIPISSIGVAPIGGTVGQVLTKNGSADYDYSWVTPSAGGGVTTIGTINSQTKSANGAVISGTSLVMQTADATSVGLVSTSSQTFAGNKIFQDGIGVTSSGPSVNGRVFIDGNITSGAVPTINGVGLAVYSYTYTDNTTSGGSTVSNQATFNSIRTPTLTATNASITYTDAANLAINEPAEGTNVTITRPRSVRIGGIGHIDILGSLIAENGASGSTLGKAGHYIFTGTTATTTLPSLATFQGAIYFIKNAGSGDLTIQRGGSDQLYDTSAVNNIIISSGSARIIVAGTAFWYVQ